jgi:hypothetical protein
MFCEVAAGDNGVYAVVYQLIEDEMAWFGCKVPGDEKYMLNKGAKKLTAHDMVYNRISNHAIMCFNDKSMVVQCLKSMAVKKILLTDFGSSVPGSPTCSGDKMYSIVGSNIILEVQPNSLFDNENQEVKVN